MKQWQQEYKSKLVTAQQAVKAVKSGDRVVTPLVVKDQILSAALWERRNELKDVKILRLGHGPNPGWLDPGYEDIFKVVISLYIGDAARPSVDSHIVEYMPGIFSLEFKALDERPADERKDVDVLFVVVSPPDNHGFCSFGYDRWHKKEYAKRAKIVIAEVDERQIRTYGDNYIHVSEIDYLVEHTPPLLTNDVVKEMLSKVEPVERRNKLWEIISGIEVGLRNEWVPVFMNVPTENLGFAPRLLGTGDPDPDVKEISKYVATLLKDGDCLQFGGGSPSGQLTQCGLLDGKHDMGVHTEVPSRGLIDYMRQGVVNNSKKNLHRGKTVCTSLMGLSQEEIEWCNMNPEVELYGCNYSVNVKTVASIDNYVAVNSAISIDLTGQINAETMGGGRVWNGALGQIDQHIGATLSNGGKGITCVRSVAGKKKVSKIVAQHEPGTVVCIPRHFADYVVSEYGIAKLMGKSERERANELIAIAHPDNRAQLREEAKKLFG